MRIKRVSQFIYFRFLIQNEPFCLFLQGLHAGVRRSIRDVLARGHPAFGQRHPVYHHWVALRWVSSIVSNHYCLGSSFEPFEVQSVNQKFEDMGVKNEISLVNKF